MAPREAKIQHALAVAEELGCSPAFVWASERLFGAEFAARSVEIMVRHYHFSTAPSFNSGIICLNTSSVISIAAFNDSISL